MTNSCRILKSVSVKIKSLIVVNSDNFPVLKFSFSNKFELLFGLSIIYYPSVVEYIF